MTERVDPKRIDWRATTWEGSRREQLERWASMSLDEILQAQEEMADLSEDLSRQARGAAFDGEAHQSCSSADERGAAGAPTATGSCKIDQ